MNQTMLYTVTVNQMVDMHSDHYVNEVHEQENENSLLGSMEDTVDQQTVTMTTTGPGSVTPADTAATESGMTLVAKNGGICQLETGDNEMADIKNDQNLNFDQRSTETGDSQQNQVTAEDPQAKQRQLNEWASKIVSCPTCVHLPVRNGLVNKVKFLGLITQNG